MKLKDVGHWAERWATPLGTLDANASVQDGVLVDLSFWGTSIIGLAIRCPDGKYFGSIRAERNVYGGGSQKTRPRKNVRKLSIARNPKRIDEIRIAHETRTL